jgi:AbrB family looped-hinge helix DNA binding protein
MKMGERGQVTIPKKLRERFGLGPKMEIEITVQSEMLVIKKAPKPLKLKNWKGKCKGSLQKLGYRTIEDYLKDVRGR